jgi:NTP pyrophosphatase (non-canonical NTP hydrolase)
MSALLSRYLKDFGEPAVIAPVDVPHSFADDLGDFPDVPAEPPVDVEAERREAHAQGYAEASAALTQKYELEAQTVAQVHQREIEELRNKYEVETAALIASRIAEIAAEVARIVSEGAAKAIAPVMTEALSEKAAVSLAALLRETILQGDAGMLTVNGPSRLFEILKNEMGEDAKLLRHHETDDVDLAVEIGETVLVTRISAWATSLKKVLE